MLKGIKKIIGKIKACWNNPTGVVWSRALSKEIKKRKIKNKEKSIIELQAKCQINAWQAESWFLRLKRMGFIDNLNCIKYKEIKEFNIQCGNLEKDEDTGLL